MKSLIYTCLLLSLGGNVVLVAGMGGVRQVSLLPKAQATDAQIGAIRSVPQAETIAGAAANDTNSSGEPIARGPNDPSLSDPRVVAARMRGEGYSDRAILMASVGAFTDRNHGEYIRTEFLGNKQTWSPGSAEAKARFAELDKELGTLIREIGGFSQETADAAEVKRRWLVYGDIPLEKVRILEAIERGYQPPVSTNIPSVGFWGYSQQKEPAYPELAEKAKQAQSWPEIQALVRTVLTPEEADDYLRYNSTLRYSPASVVQSALHAVEIDQVSYVKIADRANTLGMEAAGAELIQKIFPVMRETLGDERFLEIAPQYPVQLAGVTDLLKTFQVPAAIRADVFERVFETQQVLASRNGLGAEEAAARAAQTRDFIIQKSGLSPDQVEQLDRTYIGRILVQRINPPQRN